LGTVSVGKLSVALPISPPRETLVNEWGVLHANWTVFIGTAPRSAAFPPTMLTTAVHTPPSTIKFLGSRIFFHIHKLFAIG
jgi:hypothetical protein